MIALTGGGTGGHLSIVKALCEELNSRGIKPIYIGSTNGQDRKWFEDYDGFLKAYFLDSKGVVNKKGFGKIFSLLNIFKKAFACKKIFKQHGVCKVISVGGYSAAPASFAAVILRKDFYIHEQNAISGRLNKLLKPFSKEFFSSYENATSKVSYPISKKFFELSRQRKELKTVLFLGGSQGASFLNSLAKDLALEFKKRNLHVIHQCGKKDFEELKKFYEKHQMQVDLFDFSKDLHVKMSEADFAISRAGASSLWELVACGLPTLFIPFPFAAADHQYHNAKFLNDKNLAFLKRQNEVTKDDVLSIFEHLQTDERLENISSKLSQEVRDNGAKDIIDCLYKS